MARFIAPIIVAAMMLTVSPAAVGQSEKPEKTPEELVSEGVQMLMQAMQLFLKQVPQFGEPYVNDNGDIVIPRRHPDKEKPKAEPDLPDGQRRI